MNIIWDLCELLKINEKWTRSALSKEKETIIKIFRSKCQLDKNYYLFAGQSLVWSCPESFQPIYYMCAGFSWIGSSIHTRGEGALSRCFGSHETSTQVGKPLITLSPLLGQTILFCCRLFVDFIFQPKYQGGVNWARTFSTQSLIEFYFI